MDFPEARSLPPRMRLGTGNALADHDGRGSKPTEQRQPATEFQVRWREVPIDGSVREQVVGGRSPESCGERTGDRRSPPREGDGHEVAVEPLVASCHQRRSAFVQADEDRIDAGSRREVAAVECVQNLQGEPRRE